MLSARDTPEGVTFVENGNVEYTLKKQTLSQEKGSNMIIEYINNSMAIIFIALNGGIGALEVVETDDSLKFTRHKFVRNNPCSPGLLFKQNGTIFRF